MDIIAPRKYETMYVNRVFLFFWLSIVLLLLLLLFLCVIFYLIVSGIVEHEKTKEANRILEMQESRYVAQQRYMNETARVRHDFKHTIHTLEELVDEGDLKAIREYLDDYAAAQPKNDTTHFCENIAVNALLNFHMQAANARGIVLDWEIDLPKDLPVSDIDLSIRPDADGHLYIIASNSFDGKVRQSGSSYLSTHKNGSGIGLSSIASTAAMYGGRVNFRHREKEFYTDVLIPL